MAEGLLNHYARERNLPLSAHSAGIAAVTGYPADPMAVQLMRERSVDISAHRARQLTHELVAAADLILVMDKKQTNTVAANMPEAAGKVDCLGRWIGFDIPDPFRGPREEFVASLQLIDHSLRSWLNRLANARVA
jgi:protein-tyrosine phosphatase